MSQPCSRRTGIPQPKSVRTTVTRSTRSPESGVIETESRTTLVQVEPCSTRGGIPQPQRGSRPGIYNAPSSTPADKRIPRPTGMPQPAAQQQMRRMQQPAPQRSGMPQRSGIPQHSGVPQRSGIPQHSGVPQRSGIPQAPPAGPYQSQPQRRGIPKPTSSLAQPLEQTLNRDLRLESLKKPDSKVTVKAKQISKICRPETIQTPMGNETVLQKAVIDQRVERDAKGEKIYKSIISSKLNKDQGVVEKVQLGIQQLDPKYARAQGKEVIGVKKTVSITSTYKTTSKECTRISTKPQSKVCPRAIAKLVEEEKEDVENTLKMIPPDLTREPGRYEMKQRLQKLRLQSESMALLEQSVIRPEPSPDEAQAEPTPESVAVVMHSVEKGISPQTAPDQVFNTLFTETANEQFLKLNSITPGPLQDVVAPIEIPKEIHREMYSREVSKLKDKIMASPDIVPNVDVFTTVMEDMKKSPEKGKNKPRSYQPIKDEKCPWNNANIEHLVNVVGADPVDILDVIELELLESGDKDIEDELKNGIEYYLEANPVQYMSRVQLRGSQPPTFFPGYVVALPEFPGVVQIAKSPDEVFASAWKATQPKYFDEESMLTLNLL